MEKKPGLTKEDLADAIRVELKKLEEGAFKELGKKIINIQAEQVKQKGDIDDLSAQLERFASGC